MTAGAIAAIAYGLLALIGGIFGYVKVKSKPSLISGGISGVLLIMAGILGGTGMTWGIPIAAIITAVLVVVFAVRLIKTQKFMPAGIMLIAGIAALVVMMKG
ncbi:MAG: TMEM14 family protein [Cyanobacteria bacterium P01_E01_bin.6]